MNEVINEFERYLYWEAELDNMYKEEGIELNEHRLCDWFDWIYNETW